VQQQLGLPVTAIATLSDLLQVLQSTDSPALAAHTERVRNYRERYGV
jgi:orotate phosphoribosyltransferase